MNFAESFNVDPVFGWLAAGILTVVMLASLWLTLTAPGLSRSKRMALVALRLLAVVLLLLAWVRPGLITMLRRESPGAIAVMLDSSESMSLESGSADRTRWDVQRELYQELVEKTDLQIGKSRMIPYFYGDSVAEADVAKDSRLADAFSAGPDQGVTSLGDALEAVRSRMIDPPLRGVIMLGDFGQTDLDGADPANVARQMARVDQPVLAVGIGPSGASAARDVAVEGLPEEMAAFQGKELQVPIVVRSAGMVGQPVEVALRLKSSGRPEQLLETRTITPSGSPESLPISFNVVAPAIGDYLLEVSAKVDGREQILANNSQVGFLTVREGGARILYLEGEVRSEARFLKRALDQSLEFEVDAPRELLFNRGNARRQASTQLLRRYNLRNYDVIILGDIPQRDLSREFQTALANRIEDDQAGLLVLGGWYAFGAGGYQRSELNRLFPTGLPGREQQFDRPFFADNHLAGDVKIVPRAEHPITRLDVNRRRSDEIWRTLPALTGANRLGDVKPVPGIRVLLASPAGDPLLVVADRGSLGRVIAFAGDTTWKWVLAGQGDTHLRFWRQVMLWLVRKDSLDVGFKLTMPRRRYGKGDAPELGIEWFGGEDSEARPERWRLELSRDGKWLGDLAYQTRSDVYAQSQTKPLTVPGLYSIKLTAGNGESQMETEFSFLVSDLSPELATDVLDEQTLESIVSASSPAGGRRVLPSELDDALDWLRQRQHATRVETLERRRLGDQAWDAWLYFVLFCGVMSAEWALRKKWQLP